MYRWLFSLLIGCCLFAGTGASHAQPGTEPPFGNAFTRYVHEAWTVEQGLPQNTITAITQTRDGYLWLGTQEGLVRFDGLRFHTFDKRNSALQNLHISTLLEDTDGVLWVGTRGGGLYRFVRGRFQAHQPLPSQNISTLALDAHGALWVGTADAGAGRLRGKQLQWYDTRNGLPSNRVSALAADTAGVVWIATRDTGLVAFKQGIRKHHTRHTGLPSNDISALALDGQGVLWVGTRDAGLVSLRHGQVQAGVTPLLAGETILSLLVDWQGALWIGTDRQGLGRLAQGRLDRFSTDDGLTYNVIKALYVDREGSLWMGTDGGGLNRLRPGKVWPLTTREGLVNNYAYGVIEDAMGSLWLATEDGVQHLHNGQFTTWTTAQGLSANFVLSLAETSDGSLWMGTYERGLNRLRNGRITAYHRADGLPGEDIYALYTDTKGQLWIGTGHGLARFANEQFTTWTTAEGLSSNLITTILEDQNGHLWTGTYDGGLNQMVEGKVVRQFTTKNGLQNDYVLALHLDAEGTLWFSTREGGLYRLRNNQLKGITVQQGLFSDTIQGILEDDRGYFWMSSNVGLFRIARQELNAVADGKAATLSATVFDRTDGLKSREFNGGFQPAAWKSRTGHLWFPSAEGFVALDPYRLPRNTVAPLVVIESLIAREDTIRLQKKTILHAGQNRIALSYVGLSFIASEKVHYQYRLEGEDEDWIDAGTRREAFYTNLRPGSYRFRVRARNSDGVWSTQEASINLYLEPYFWQTWWFWLGVALALLLVAFRGYRWRIEQLRERHRELERVVHERTHDLRLEKEKTEQALAVIEEQADRLREMDRIKTRFFNNISHEFRTPLTLTIGPLENAVTGAYGEVNETLRGQLDIMLRNARRLLRLINQLLDLAKLEAGRMVLRPRQSDLVPFVEGVVLSFTPFVEKKGIQLTFNADPAEQPLCFDAPHLEKVFFNLLSNAVKFTPDGGRIDVQVRDGQVETGDGVREAVEVRIQDTGTGIPEAEQPYIFDRFHQVDGAMSQVQEGTGIGLALVKELVELHGGTIDVESEVGVGTTFTVTLLKGTAHFDPSQLVAVEVEAEELPARGPMVEMVVLDEDDPTPATPRPGIEALLKPRILVVDDNQDIRTYVAACLGNTYDTYTAKDGREGLEKAARLLPDLLITDVNMPEMNGIELCRALKQDTQLAAIPVLVLTSKASLEDKIETLEAGADDYLTKPFSARELLVRIQNLLNLRSQQRALQHLNAELQQTNVALTEANELKLNLLHMASHDLKNPLFAVRELTRVLKEDIEAGSPLQELLNIIMQSSENMLQIILQLLDTAALESGKIVLHLEPVELTALAQQVVYQNKKLAENKGQQLRFYAAPGTLHMAEVDEERILEAIDNLVSNAIKYSPFDTLIDIRVEHTGAELVVSVTDHGPGLNEQDKAKLFGKFQKLSPKPTGGESSTGLGLAIVKQIMEMHHGQVRVESVPGNGSTFSLVFRPLTTPTARSTSASEGTAA
jgi:signal transduction histidine kinase/ligand-binding sensor domain-containing protein